MKKYLLAAALALPLAAAACPAQNINTAGSVVSATAQAEIDRVYTDFGKLVDRVDTARVSGKLVPGTPDAISVADDLAATRNALHSGDLARARAAMARIDAKLGAL